MHATFTRHVDGYVYVRCQAENVFAGMGVLEVSLVAEPHGQVPLWRPLYTHLAIESLGQHCCTNPFSGWCEGCEVWEYVVGAVTSS